ncbi:hypothetical protein SSP24_83530 [Streptomyces spinoverrucosus]|uniref:Sialidase domain-containing protein n=1 Tax=Streptomyces spinoverrucosus TaxID=284043 RepID=A0A4Y3VWU7_9ACTN|nr:hypothetical protein SSP24_83530 [Streptomyces spinoverrucosus]GHB99648.1 hypothetical protein GCM10010397_84730 [Streptomyces spinoverrucosus]
MQLDYAIPTSAGGSARRDADLVVTASHIRGASSSRVRVDAVELSYDDGRTWHRAKLRDAEDGAARAELDAPLCGPPSCPCQSTPRTRRATP